MKRIPGKKLAERIQHRISSSAFTGTATIIYKTVNTYDSYGQVTYSESTSTVDCSFTDRPSPEAWAEYADIESVQAEIRFIGTKPSKGDTVTLTHRFDRDDYDDQNYAEETFEIVGIKDRDVFGYVCALKKVAI